jgi:hypothetical protein
VHMVESRSITLSIALHVVAVLIGAFGLPAILPPRAEPMPLVMTVELLPVGEMTNVKPSEKAIQEEKKAPTPKTPKPVTPSAQEKPKEEAKPVEQEKTFDPMEGAEPEKPKPNEKPKEEKKEEPKKDDFAALLNQLKQEAKTDKSKDAKDKTNAEENKTRSDAPYDDSMPLSISEKDTIRSQFLLCWSMPAGAKDAHTLAVRVQVQLQADGTVLAAALAKDQLGRYNADPFFRAAADSAIRAVHKCSPLKNLPPDKYGAWRDMELNFDPQDML